MNALLRIAAWTLAIVLVALPVVAVLNGWIAGERWPMRRLAVTGEFRQVDFNALDLPHADFLVRHFATAEAQGDLHLVFFLQEARHVAQLDLVVVLVGTRAKFDFLDLNLLLLQLLLVLALLFLVLKLAVIHDPANRGLRQRSNFDQINAGFVGHLERLTDVHNAERLTVGTD